MSSVPNKTDWVHQLSGNLSKKIDQASFKLSSSSSVLDFSFLPPSLLLDSSKATSDFISLNKELDLKTSYTDDNITPKSPTEFTKTNPDSVSRLDSYFYCKKFSKDYSLTTSDKSFSSPIDNSTDTLLSSWKTNFSLEQSYSSSNQVIQQKVLSLKNVSYSKSQALQWWGLKSSEPDLSHSNSKPHESIHQLNVETLSENIDHRDKEIRYESRTRKSRHKSRERRSDQRRDRRDDDSRERRIYNSRERRSERERTRDTSPRRYRDDSRESYRTRDKYSARSRDRDSYKEKNRNRSRDRYSSRDYSRDHYYG